MTSIDSGFFFLLLFLLLSGRRRFYYFSPYALSDGLIYLLIFLRSKYVCSILQGPTRRET